jgi:hypothetical protein
MDNKVLINVLLPATGKTYDFWVPERMTAHDAALFVAEILGQRESSYFANTGSNVLALRETGAILEQNTTFAEHGITCGHELMLL